MADQDIRELVKEKYGRAALKVTAGGPGQLLWAGDRADQLRGPRPDHR